MSDAPLPWCLDKYAGNAGWRRVLLAVLVIATAAFGAFLMWKVLAGNGVNVAELAFLAVFVVVFAWSAISFWSGFFGFLLGVLRLHPVTLRRRRPADGEVPVLRERTAILIPVYNEDPTDVCARLEANYRSLEATGRLDSFHFFMLSDTTNAEIAREEALAWSALRDRLQAAERLFYRRREANVGKKAGNIAEWIQTRGPDYAHMIILDADSTMDGNTVVRLAALMEANPQTGIIQTHIVPAGRETLFARALQFSTRMTGAVLAMGTSFWQMGEANYYGHNAILRVSAFAACCRLPVLSGPPPLGGEILSHDFVEAAYLRRGGWHCWMLPELRGSYEEVPTNLLDYAVRDRRWVQGNLQHARLIGERGLHGMSRLHLGMGIFAYLASPLWLLMLLLSSSLVVDHTLTGDVYFGPTRSLFPIWPQIRWPEIHGLLALTGVLLFGPKLLALALRLWSRRNARRFGGRASLIVSFLGEIALTTLLAPVMMLFHTTFVLGILAGNAVGWPAQPRGDRGMPWKVALRRHILHALFGVVAMVTLGYLAPSYLPWILPVVAGLILSIPIAVLTSRRDVGVAARRAGVFVTPEEGRSTKT